MGKFIFSAFSRRQFNRHSLLIIIFPVFKAAYKEWEKPQSFLISNFLSVFGCCVFKLSFSLLCYRFLSFSSCWILNLCKKYFSFLLLFIMVYSIDSLDEFKNEFKIPSWVDLEHATLPADFFSLAEGHWFPSIFIAECGFTFPPNPFCLKFCQYFNIVPARVAPNT